MLKHPFLLVPMAPCYAARIEALNADAFGPGRYVKTAHRMREHATQIEELGGVALDGEEMVGSVQFWQLSVDGKPALLLGPLAVAPSHRNIGIGRALIDRSLARARELGHRLVILVGDPPYYARNGFKPVPRGQILLPGPVDYGRLLACELVDGALRDVAGLARVV